MTTITTTRKVLLSPYGCSRPDQVALNAQDHVDFMSFPTCNIEGYTEIGTAEITITLHDRDEIVANKLGELKARLQQTQADAEVACNRIREQIQSLLAITYQPEAVES